MIHFFLATCFLNSSPEVPFRVTLAPSHFVTNIPVIINVVVFQPNDRTVVCGILQADGDYSKQAWTTLLTLYASSAVNSLLRLAVRFLGFLTPVLLADLVTVNSAGQIIFVGSVSFIVRRINLHHGEILYIVGYILIFHRAVLALRMKATCLLTEVV